eukprot:jgi/Bigna1/81351/fgenesh1_pg.79_\
MQRVSSDSEKFMSLSYVFWAATKTIVVFSVLIHLGQKRYNLVDGFYNNKEVCQKCYDAAKANGGYEFEFSRCVKSFDMPSDSSNIHKGESHGWNYDSTLALEDNYVVLPAIFLGLSILVWFLILWCTSVVSMLSLHDLGGGVECYVHVIGKKFQLAISSITIVFVGLELVRWCLEQHSTTYHTLLLSEICVVFLLMVLYTAQAGMAAKQGVYESVIFALVAWQIATEVPSLAVICKTLFDLSAALRNYGMLPGGPDPIVNGDDNNNENENAGLLEAQSNSRGSVSGTPFVGEARRV